MARLAFFTHLGNHHRPAVNPVQWRGARSGPGPWRTVGRRWHPDTACWQAWI